MGTHQQGVLATWRPDRRAVPGFAAFLLLFAAACVQVRPQPDFEEAGRLVEESTGSGEAFDPYAPVLTDQEILVILGDGLSADEALRLAILNNRELQAEFLEIGIAHADWVQSLLLSNPTFDLLLRVPTGGGRSMLEGILGVELLELRRIPLRKKSARNGLDATILRAARRAGERLARTKAAYYAAVSAEELLQVAEQNLARVTQSFTAVQDLHRAGAADAFDESLARRPVLTATLAIHSARLEAATAKRELAKQLSIDLPVDDLRLTDNLPVPVGVSFETEALVELALTSRLDLRSMSKLIDSLEARLELERRKVWGDAAVGPTAERPAGGGDSFVGGALSLTLPLFDQNQAQIARADFELQRLRKVYDGARVDVAQDVRTAVDRAATTVESLRFYREELIPQAEHSLTLAQDSYSAGRATLFVLLEAQRQLLEARRGHVVIRLEAASASADLERVVGCPLLDRPPTPDDE